MVEESGIGRVVFHPFSLGLLTAATAAALGSLLTRRGSPSSVIRRYRNSPRSYAAVEHGGVVYLSGQVAKIETLASTDIKQQTRETLEKVEELLKEAGTDKEHILSSQIWLKDIKKDFEGMNEVWNAWVHPTNKGVRACVESRMAREHILVEIKVIAAVP